MALTWATYSLPVSSFPIRASICVGANKFVAVGDAGRVYTSSDGGQTWTSRTASSSNRWVSLAYDGTTVVAVANSGAGTRVMFSTDDGATWTAATTVPSANNWQGVCSPSSGVFVAVSSNGVTRTMRSTDSGVTWSGVAASPVLPWGGVATDGSIIVAKALEDTMVSSNAGVSWTSYLAACPAYNGNASLIQYSGTLGNFVGYGWNGSNQAVIYGSPDGQTWSLIATTITSHLGADGLVVADSFGGFIWSLPFTSGLVSSPTIIGSSDDGGANWAIDNTGFASDVNGWNAGAWDPATATVVFFDRSSVAVLVGSAAPTVISVSPPSGSTLGGTAVTITGTNFSGTPAVTFDGEAATSVVVVNATTITCVTPAHASGLVTVAVDAASLVNGYRYRVPVLAGLNARMNPGVTIDLVAGNGSNRATATVGTTPPDAGENMRIFDPATETQLFGGSAVLVDHTYDLTQTQSVWPITGAYWTYLFNRRRPFGTWSNISATDIATDLVNDFSDGFTTAGIATDLPLVTDFTLDGSLTLTEAFAALQGLVPGIQFTITIDRDVVFGYHGPLVDQTDTFSGDGATNLFTLTYPIGGVVGGVVSYDDGGGPVDETLSLIRSTPGSAPTASLNTDTWVNNVHGVLEDVTFSVAFLYSDGTESFAVDSNTLATIDADDGWVLSGIPTGGGTVVGRRVYMTFTHQGQVVPQPTRYQDIPDNTTTTIENTDDAGGYAPYSLTNVNLHLMVPALNLADPLTPGDWQYDDTGPHTITRVAGVPAAGVDNIVITYQRNEGIPEEVVDGSPFLQLHPPPVLTEDVTQLRNRVFGRGVGGTTTETVAAGDDALPLTDLSMYLTSEYVFILTRPYVVTDVDYVAMAIVVSPVLEVDVPFGTPVWIWVQGDDVDSQTERAAIEDDGNGDGIHEGPILNFTDWLISPEVVGDAGERAAAEYAAMRSRVTAELTQFAWPIETFVYYTRDVKALPGREVTVNLTDPAVEGQFMIQMVAIDQIAIDQPQQLEPRLKVTATKNAQGGSVRFTFDDLIQWAQIRRAQMG